MEMPDLQGIMDILTRVGRWVDIVAKVVNPLMAFMLPILFFIGDLLRDVILWVNTFIPVGNYTWFIVVTSVVGVVAIVLTFLFPGEKPEDD
ncbi:MAG: hypothetical protein EU530_01780 [Promethearchaeota archaeon]|nr:MAG: hypothetical protein EU530_01780 [Candidatus Lokiarchaeota archaeon]